MKDIVVNLINEIGGNFMIGNIIRCQLMLNRNYQQNYFLEKVKLKRLYQKNEFIN